MSENSILKELEYNQSSGTLSYKGVRYLLIRPETVAGFQKEIEKVAGEKAKKSLYQGGFSGGYLSAKKYRELFNFSDKEIIEFMMRMGTEIGWGGFSLDYYNPGSGTMHIAVRNSPFAQSYGKSSEGVCHLIRGVVGGMASAIFNQDCTASELECISKGDDRCLFVVDLKLQSADILTGKRILIVDDEPDILVCVEETLDMCIVDRASDFETARRLIQKETYDAAILDIMGVKGYELLEITKNNGIPTLMLTAHALNPEDFIKSVEGGAQAYMPKEKISEIQIFLRDILETRQKEGHKIGRWFVWLEDFFENRFGPEWQKKADPEFWKKYFYI